MITQTRVSAPHAHVSSISLSARPGHIPASLTPRMLWRANPKTASQRAAAPTRAPFDATASSHRVSGTSNGYVDLPERGQQERSGL